jgi:hypothetical protein
MPTKYCVLKEILGIVMIVISKVIVVIHVHLAEDAILEEDLVVDFHTVTKIARALVKAATTLGIVEDHLAVENPDTDLDQESTLLAPAVALVSHL